MLTLSDDQIESMRDHAGREYPNECCGMLLGRVEGEDKRVAETVPLPNLRNDPEKAQELLPLQDLGRESERNRFLIDPRDQMRVEKDARSRGLDVLGYYHSHPDHPARPSNYDRDHAWPWYSYVILSVSGGEPQELNSWVLSPDGSAFDPEQINRL